MNITRLTATVLTALTVLAATSCSSSSTTGTATVNRTDPRAVSDAFAKAWGAADLATACSYMNGSALRNLTAAHQCTGTGGWAAQTPREFHTCDDFSGGLSVYYRVDQQVDGFQIFSTQVTQTGTSWAVTGFSENSVGEQLHGCIDDAQPSGTA